MEPSCIVGQPRVHVQAGAALKPSFVAFTLIVALSFESLTTRIESKLTATSRSPIPRKPPTPTITAATLPVLSMTTSLMSPIVSPAAFLTLMPIILLARCSPDWRVYHFGNPLDGIVVSVPVLAEPGAGAGVVALGAVTGGVVERSCGAG
jgi:hypothetical protein